MAFDYDVRIRPIKNPSGRAVAFAQLIIDNAVEIDGFKVVSWDKGLFVSAPQHKGKNKDGEDGWFDDVRFLGDRQEGERLTSLQKEIYAAMIQKYQQVSNAQNRGATAAANTIAQNPMANNKLWGSQA